MNPNVKEAYELWRTSEYFNEATKAELESIADNPKEIEERFYQDLSFGTGGLRGIMGAGTNRMNIYTVRKATQGLANFILKEKKEKQGVAIAYDSRNQSPVFAKEAAKTLVANGIKAYVFTSLRPTPQLSFALRTLGCCAGIVITASHNPPEYNGYKVYWEDGAQVTSPKDVEIIKEVNSITDYNKVFTLSMEEALESGLYQTIGEDIDEAYYKALEEVSLFPNQKEKINGELKIVYTPLHGSGLVPVRQILKRLGFEKVDVVKAQEEPDGNFPTVGYPNPEDDKAFTLALELGKEKKADIVLATDPDADRLGAFVYDPKTDSYQKFTGNMIGSLLVANIAKAYQAQGKLSSASTLVTTIVSGKMAKAIALDFGMQYMETLTGFKYIGEKIKEFETDEAHEYVFGFEESYGCLAGTHARDKDAVVAVMLLCEIAAHLKAQGLTLVDEMNRLYDTYGYYQEALVTKTMKGKEGLEKIQSLMEAIRNNPPKKIRETKVVRYCDYLKDEQIFYPEENMTSTGLPKSDVLYFELEDGGWCCIRPSGTEPKIKLYIGVKAETKEQAQVAVELLESSLSDLI